MGGHGQRGAPESVHPSCRTAESAEITWVRRDGMTAVTHHVELVQAGQLKPIIA